MAQTQKFSQGLHKPRSSNKAEANLEAQQYISEIKDSLVIAIFRGPLQQS